jgi:hypothetical protein
MFTAEGYINPWIPLTILPAIIGTVAGYMLHRRTAILVAAAVPWLGLLAVLLWLEFVQQRPAEGGSSR